MEEYEFSVPCTWQCFGAYKILATSLEEAAQKAEDMDELPESDGFVDGSFEINYDMLEFANMVTLEIIKIRQTPKEKLPLLIGQLETKEAKIILNERLKEL